MFININNIDGYTNIIAIDEIRRVEQTPTNKPTKIHLSEGKVVDSWADIDKIDRQLKEVLTPTPMLVNNLNIYSKKEVVSILERVWADRLKGGGWSDKETFIKVMSEKPKHG